MPPGPEGRPAVAPRRILPVRISLDERTGAIRRSPFRGPVPLFSRQRRQVEGESAYGKYNHTATRPRRVWWTRCSGSRGRPRARGRYVRCSARTLYAAAKHGPGGRGLVPSRGFQGVVGDIVAENLGFRLFETDIVHCVNLSRAGGTSGQKKRRRGLRRLMSETYRSGSH